MKINQHYPENNNRPVSIILDTDMGNDIDDALALAMLHALESRGESRLLGVSICKDHPCGAAYVDLLNTFYGRGDIPIGVVHNGATPESGKYAQQVVDMRDASGRPLYARTVKSSDGYPGALTMLRRLLADADDGRITVVMIGFSTNMARLLESPPDAISPLPGRDLFARKVARVVMMAANFSSEALNDPKRAMTEFNIVKDIASAARFISGCPTPIVFTGLEIGKKILYPATSIENDFNWTTHHPVVDAYRLYQPMPYDRPTWDLTAVLQAVRPEGGYFGLSEPGVAEVHENGYVSFTPDTTGRHRYLTADAAQCAAVQAIQIELASQPTDAAQADRVAADAVF
ncbi:MAG: nucleoside hydrolase [Phycisphaeraceae bacterium]|nr:nucleoside hydrolase [Phycisphaeraceae bacterium]